MCVKLGGGVEEEVTLSVRVGICNISVFYHPAMYRSPSLMEVDE